MTAYRHEDEDRDWDDASDDDEDEADGPDDDEPTVPCPSCGRDILEDSPYCPSCDRYLSAEDHAMRRPPLWIIATALVCLAVALLWVLMPLG